MRIRDLTQSQVAGSPERYSIKAKTETEAEIWIYEEIGDGWFGGLSARQFAKDVKALGDKIERITVRLNSPGGDVFDGNAIYNILKQHKARVIVHIDGLAASIASVIAMAGDEINIADNALMMVHNAWGFCMGYASDMRQTADLLDKVDGTIVTTYCKRTELDESKVKDLMAAETWMNAQEALDYGFVDNITDAMQVAAHFDLSKFRYRNAPAQPAGTASASGRNEIETRSKLAHMTMVTRKLRVASNPKK